MRPALTVLAGGLIAVTASTATASVTIDFSVEDDGVTPLSNGQIIDTEFGTIFTLSHSSGPGAGLVIFDTTTGVNGADPDLWVDSGNALTVQESSAVANDGSFFTTPNDDDGDNTITFAFLQQVELLSLDLIDINGNGPAEVLLTDADGLTRTYFAPLEWTGDPEQGEPGIGTIDLTLQADQAGPNGLDATFSQDIGFDPQNVATLDVTFFGSGAVDNLELQVVPAPSALALLLGAAGVARRRRRA